MKEVYITRVAKFLPNDPISNEEMESKLGVVNGVASTARCLVLRNNQIETRYYAIDKAVLYAILDAEGNVIRLSKKFQKLLDATSNHSKKSIEEEKIIRQN